MTGIIGGGFGLYGYLPAVMQHDEKVGLLSRVKEKFFSRDELTIFQERVTFFDDFDFFLRSISKLVISIPPHEQSQILQKILTYDNIKFLFLEKPIDTDPIAAIELEKQLALAKKNYAICYSFLYTDWYNELKNLILKNEGHINRINLEWKFKAHHYKNDVKTWKRNVKEGGGVIRFYGIHIIAILASLDFENIVKSKVYGSSSEDLSRWELSIANKRDNIIFTINIDCNSDLDVFSVESFDKNDLKIDEVTNQPSPFGDGYFKLGDIDSRAVIISNYMSYINSLETLENEYVLYEKVNHLWENMERKSELIL
jgi:hypothetical protein